MDTYTVSSKCEHKEAVLHLKVFGSLELTAATGIAYWRVSILDVQHHGEMMLI